MTNHDRFIILGCHRTGTTLMRLITDSHPRVHCLDENTSYACYGGGRRPATKPGATMIGFKLPNWTELFLEYKGIASYYQGEPVVFMLRNVYDTVASMRALKTGPGQRFIDGVLRSLDEWTSDEDRRRFRQRHVPDLERAAVRPCPEVAKAAIFWRYKTEAFFDMEEAGFNVLPVRYEALTTDPGPQIERVAAFLGLEFHPDLLRHDSVEHTEVLGDGTTIGRTNARRPIDSRSVGRCGEILTDEEYRVIEVIAGDLDGKVRELLTPSEG